MIKNEDFELPTHPLHNEIKCFLNALGVFVWGEYVADGTIHTDYDNDACFTTHDMYRKQEAEGTWIYEKAQDEAEEYPEFQALSVGDVDYQSSTLYPVSDSKLEVCKRFLNSLDAFVMGEEITVASYFKNTVREAYDYQCVDMFEYDKHYESEAM